MRTNSKQVKDLIKEHILNQWTLEEIKHDLEAVKNHKYDTNQYILAKRLVESGNFLVYHDDVVEFLNSLGINPENKVFESRKCWELYQHLLATNIVELLK